MQEVKRLDMKKGFTLIELLIVILIVSMVYFLGFDGVELGKKKPKALSPLNLKSTIVSSDWFGSHVTLLCVNDCKTCFLRKGLSASYSEYSNAINLSNIKAYTVDESDSLLHLEYERYDDQKICLKMDFYPNGSSTQIILADKQGAYFLPAYFEDAKKFESPEDAKDYWLESSRLVADNGEFY